MVKTPRPHDLLWLADASTLAFDGATPGWVTPRWLDVAPVVVRRAPARAAVIPVGLRGTTRSERCAAWAASAGVVRIVEPEAVARVAIRAPPVRASSLGCLRALARLAPLLETSALAWGVTGGVGFTLASGVDVLRPDSDLDLVLRAPSADAAAALRMIAAALVDIPARVDVQVDTGAGAFALAEWLRADGPLLLKADAGPRLVDDPWGPA